ncbi:PHP domain-containing protein [bacterium]|nr:PHP domain-containing protein [bacterium]
MYVDLHIHSCASDGTLTAEETIAACMEKDITLFSVTDHNSIACNAELRNLIKLKDISYIQGVEIASTFKGREFHITVYGFDETNKEFRELLRKHTQDVEENFCNKFIECFSNQIPQLNLEEFNAYLYDLRRGGSKLLNYLMDKKVLKNLDEYFLLAGDFISRFRIFSLPRKVIDIARKAGGYPFLAHPPAYYSCLDHFPEKELDEWRGWGIAGIECYSPYFREGENEKYIQYCIKNGLLISGGSDYHGTFTERKLGSQKITPDMINLGDIRIINKHVSKSVFV